MEIYRNTCKFTRYRRNVRMNNFLLLFWAIIYIRMVNKFILYSINQILSLKKVVIFIFSVEHIEVVYGFHHNDIVSNEYLISCIFSCNQYTYVTDYHTAYILCAMISIHIVCIQYVHCTYMLRLQKKNILSFIAHWMGNIFIQMFHIFNTIF